MEPQARKKRNTRLWVAYAAALVVLALPLVFRLYAVTGDSMAPQYHSGDVLFVERVSHFFLPLRREEVIVMRNPHKYSEIVVKRVIGLPKETVVVGEKDLTIFYSDGTEEYFASTTMLGGGFGHNNVLEARMQLGPEDYFVMGDNRQKSLDSRAFGAAQQHDFIGRVLWNLPIKAIQ